MSFLTSNNVKEKTKYLLGIGLISIIAFASLYGFLGADVAEASLKSQILNHNAEELEDTADAFISGIVSTAREIAFGLILVVVLWIGYSILVKKSVEGLADVKGRAAIILIAIAFIFFAEQLVGTIFGWFGYSAT